jgi:hypothetical protein
MVRTFLKVYMELGSYFLFLQEQIKDIIIISKVGLLAAKAAALRINLNVLGCGIVAAPVHAPSRAPLIIPLLFHTIYLSPVFTSVWWSD